MAVRRTFDESKRHEFYVWLFLNNEKGAEQFAVLGQEFLRRGLYPLGRYFSSTKGFNEQSQAVKAALKTPKVKKLKTFMPEIVEEQEQQDESVDDINADINAFERQNVEFGFEDFEEAVACD